MLTPNQIDELLRLLEYQHILFSARHVGTEVLSEKDLQLLSEFGVDPIKLSTISSVEEAYRFGMLSEALGHTRASDLSYNDLKKFISEGRYLPYTTAEQATLNHLKQTTYSHIKGLGNKIAQDTRTVLIESDQKRRVKYEKVLKKEMTEAALNRQTIGETVLNIGNRTGDWSRDFGRIVETELHNAFEHGRSAAIKKRNGGDADVYVYKDVYLGACWHCIRLFLTNGIGSKPKIFELSELEANGTNYGLKTKDWKPVLGPVHPYCFDDETEVLTDKGWLFFKDLDKTERFLSVDLGTGNAEWLKAVNWVEEKYQGKLHHFHGKNFDLKTTPNHRHVIRTWAKKDYRLIGTLELPKQSQFLKHIPDWRSEKIDNFIFDNKKYEGDLWVEFMGYYISEGNVRFYKKNNTHQIFISQQKENIRSDIKRCLQLLFDKVWEAKEGFYVPLYKNQIQLREYLLLGVSGEKYVPKNIKNLPQDQIQIFLKAFAKGDGTIRKGRDWDGYKSKDQITLYTSSKKLEADLGEMILKIGQVPSYRNMGKSSVFDKKQGKTYVSKNDQIRITLTASKHAYRNSLREDVGDYDGMIYDVELEKYHTLIVRRNGKVCVSGNCRCTINEVPQGYEWDEEKKSFSKPKKFERKVPRQSKVKIKVGDEEYNI